MLNNHKSRSTNDSPEVPPSRFWFDCCAVVAVITAFFLLAITKLNYPESLTWLQHDMTDHRGAEYDSIAHAIVAGRGFSDPFRSASGPTAWMPPVLPYLLAASYFLSDSNREAAVGFLLAIQSLAIFLTAMIVVRQARRLQHIAVGYVIVVAGLSLNFHELFQRTHDSGWLLMLVNRLWLGVVYMRPRITIKREVIWGGFGGLCMLSSPVLGMVWMVASVMKLRFQRTSLLIAICISALTITPWTIRNRVVMGRWIPIKSNGMYELWQSQCADDDGVVDLKLFREHPWAHNGLQRAEYVKVGEIAFIAEKGKLATAAIANQPLDFITRILNRSEAALIYYPLFQFKELYRGDGWPLFIKRIAFPLPLLGCFIILILRRPRMESAISTAMMIWILTLLPYILISYYERYAIPLIGMKLLIVLYGYDTLRHVSEKSAVINPALV